MKMQTLVLFLLGSVLFLSSCTAPLHDGKPALALQAEPAAWCRVRALPAESREKILALDPEHVTEREVQDFLSQLPAPRIISIHGGLLRVNSSMNSFTRFLVGLGYPEASLRNPGNGEYAYGHYSRAEEIAGTIAWYYEQDGLRPMMIGHSLGGIQAIRVLHLLAGESTPQVTVWNPLTGRDEKRNEIIDPLTGKKRPVVDVQLSYASAAMAGGLARIIPGQWDMNSKLRDIPDSVEEFTGFQKGFDLLGGDFMGYGSANDWHATGRTVVRNVRLPAVSPHSNLTYADRLLKSQEIKDWISQYHPTKDVSGTVASDVKFGMKAARILWAGEVWYSIKKHWVLELQRLTRASFPQDHGT